MGLGMKEHVKLGPENVWTPAKALTVLWENGLGELEETAEGICVFSGKPAGLLIEEPRTGAVPCEDTNFLSLLFS